MRWFISWTKWLSCHLY